MAAVPQSAAGDPFAMRFSIYKMLSGLGTYSLHSLEDAFAVAKANPTRPGLVKEQEENDRIEDCIGNLEMSIITAETALEESVQLIEQNYCILLDRRITQRSSDDFASDSGSNVSKGHCNSNTDDTMGQGASEPYDKLALLRSQVYFHRPNSPSTLCASPPHSNSESCLPPPTPRLIGTSVPHDPFLPTPDQSPAFTMTALTDMTRRPECASSSYEERNLASTTLSSADEVPEPVDENFFAWLTLQGQLTATTTSSLTTSPQLPLALANSAQISASTSDSVEPIDLPEASADTSTLSLPTPPPTTKLSSLPVFNDETLNAMPFFETCPPSSILQGLETRVSDIKRQDEEDSYTSTPCYARDLNASYHPPGRVLHQFQQVIAELQLSHVIRGNSTPAKKVAVQSSSRYPVTIVETSPTEVASRFKDSGKNIVGICEDDMASAEADRLALALLETSIEEEHLAKRLRDLARRLNDLSHLRRSVAAALTNM